MSGILKSTSWTLASNVWLSLSNIILLKFLSDFFVSDIFGENLYIYSNAILIGSVFGIGVGTVVNQSQSIKEKNRNYVFNCLNSYLGLLFLILLTLFLVWFLVLDFSLGGLNFISVFYGLLIVFFYCFDNINRSFLIGNKIIVPVSIFLIISSILGWSVSFICSYLNVPSGFLIGMLFSAVANFLFSLYLVSLNIKLKFIFNFHFFWTLLKQKVGLSLASQVLGSLPQILISSALLVYYGGQVVAIYLIGMYIFRGALFVPSAIQRILLPYLGEKKLNDRESLMKRCIFINGAICIPLVFLTLFFTDLIAQAYSFTLDEVGNLFIYTALAGLLAAMSSPLGQFMTSFNKYALTFKYNLIWCVNYIIISYFIMVLGLHVEFLMLGLTLCYFLHFILGGYLICRLKNEIGH
ncbi:hypothetical protein [Pseudoalteromonas rubra]|nr:hypothetical protein [Pseudoalteromonas rubra]